MFEASNIAGEAVSPLYDWRPQTTYIRRPPYWEGALAGERTLKGMRPLAVLGDNITTDHLSPSNAIMASSAAGEYLAKMGLPEVDFNNALMGLPPVVVGLLVYLMLSNSGPMGVLQLLYTPWAMIIAQFILVTPIVAALTRQTVETLNEEYADQLRSLGVSRLQSVPTLLWDGRFALATAVLAGFGRAIAEVGAVMIVGGNINHVTRVMTTTIALETSKGNLALALALGAILILLALAVNAAVALLDTASRQVVHV